MYMSILPKRTGNVEDETASLSVAQGKKLLFGDEAALEKLRKSLADLKKTEKTASDRGGAFC